jgi:hypothetical protein
MPDRQDRCRKRAESADAGVAVATMGPRLAMAAMAMATTFQQMTTM